MSSLDQLKLLMKPPAEVSVPLTWEDVEVELGIRFPPGYMGFLAAYGQGGIEPELGIMDPRRIDFFRSWTSASTAGIGLIPPEELYIGDPEPYPAFPAEGRSLLPIAGNGNSDTLFLVVIDSAATEDEMWIGNVRDGMWVQVSGPLSALLVRLLTGERRSELGPFDYWAWELEPIWTAAAPES